MLAIDTESEYSKHLGIQTHGVGRYVRETKHYLVAGYDGQTAWVREPRACGDPLLFNPGDGCCAHNAAYDGQVLAQLGVQANLLCTADAAAYHQHPRALKGVMKTLFGIDLDKGMRDFMKGKTWDSLPKSAKEKVAEYCLLDAKASWHVSQQLFPTWPEHERKLSQHTAMMCRRGIGVDVPLVESGITKMAEAAFAAAKRVPWFTGEDDDVIASPKEIAIECRKRGIPPPASTDVKSDEFAMWLDAHEKDADFVQAVQEWRKANRLLRLLEAILKRQIDGRLIYGLKYFGATHTGRWSGDQGLNLQNLPRAGYLGVDARNCFIPKPGHKFIVGDLAQIEARVALWLAGDERQLTPIRQGMDIYEAHARGTMGYTDPRPLKETAPDRRQMAKCRVLGLGFGMGGGKFQTIVKAWTGVDISEGEAKQQVANYRNSNRPITAAWKMLERGLRDSLGGVFESELPSGRKLRYFDVSGDGARVEHGGPIKNLFGGLLFENVVQATAREIFAAAILRCEQRAPVVLHCHDEAVQEVPEAEAEEAKHQMEKDLTTVPDWAAGLPVAAEVKILERYEK